MLKYAVKRTLKMLVNLLFALLLLYAILTQSTINLILSIPHMLIYGAVILQGAKLNCAPSRE